MDSLIALPDSLLLYENKFRLMEKPYPLSKYVRQYLAAQQGDNILVWVNLIGTSEDGSIDTFFDYNYIIWVEDGGPRFGEALVDLTRKKIIYLSINSRE